MALTCEQLLYKYAPDWEQATVHPFLEQCKSGEIKPEQFNTWLVQDYLFVLEFTRLLGAILANAPPEHFDVLLGGLSAIKAELNWFQEKAQERQLNLDTKKQTSCQHYCDYMHNVVTMPYPVQATVLWAIEQAYNQAWKLPGEMTEPYNEFADRWGNPGFTEYVKQLEKQTNDALAEATEVVEVEAETAFLKIASLEKDFWQMAFNAT
ncbi:MAG: TenA family transcriptional regulator [Halothece sp.]